MPQEPHPLSPDFSPQEVTATMRVKTISTWLRDSAPRRAGTTAEDKEALQQAMGTPVTVTRASDYRTLYEAQEAKLEARGTRGGINTATGVKPTETDVRYAVVKEIVRSQTNYPELKRYFTDAPGAEDALSLLAMKAAEAITDTYPQLSKEAGRFLTGTDGKPFQSRPSVKLAEGSGTGIEDEVTIVGKLRNPVEPNNRNRRSSD